MKRYLQSHLKVEFYDDIPFYVDVFTKFLLSTLVIGSLGLFSLSSLSIEVSSTASILVDEGNESPSLSAHASLTKRLNSSGLSAKT